MPAELSQHVPVATIVFAGSQLSVIGYLCGNLLNITLVIFRRSTLN